MENKHRPYYPISNRDRKYSEDDDNGCTKFEKFAKDILCSILSIRRIDEAADIDKAVKDANDITHLMFKAMEQK